MMRNSNYEAEITLKYDLPLSVDEARERSLPSSIHRVVLSSPLKSTEKLAVLADLTLNRLYCPMYVNAINPFLSTRELGQLARKHHLQSCSRTDEPVYILPKSARVLEILNELDAEEIVIFTLSTMTIENFMEVINEYSENYQSHNSPYIANLDECPVFSFYAQNHASFEFLGKKEAVVSTMKLLVSNIESLIAHGLFPRLEQ